MQALWSLTEMRAEILAEVRKTGDTTFQGYVDSWLNREAMKIVDKYDFTELMVNWYIALSTTAPTPHTCPGGTDHDPARHGETHERAHPRRDQHDQPADQADRGHPDVRVSPAAGRREPPGGRHAVQGVPAAKGGG